MTPQDHNLGLAAESSDLMSASQLQQLTLIARAVMPAGLGLPGASAQTVQAAVARLHTLSSGALRGYLALLPIVDGLARLRLHKPLHKLTVDQTLTLCQWLYQGDFVRRNLVRALVTPLKTAHFEDPRLWQAVSAPHRPLPVLSSTQTEREHPAVPSELSPAAHQRTQRACDLPAGETLECDIVVIGSGAGGAVAAYELAAAGHAVLLVEEGRYFGRSDFTGPSFYLQRLLYRSAGSTATLGNTVIPVPVGRTVGGTTTVNSGTCYRMPERIYADWQTHHGLAEYTEAALAPSYERVEAVLGVQPAASRLVGAAANAVGKACDELGYVHGPLRRNAPDCDGQGLCCFGCPTDAKRSTNVSYVPLALQAGAQLLTEAKAEHLLIEHGRAVGVKVRPTTKTGTSQHSDDQALLTIRAQAVVVACGALMTPVLLQSDPVVRQALGRSGALGSNLTIHPAAAALAVFDQPLHSCQAIPQGYAIEEFHREGILFENAFLPLDLTAMSVTMLGPDFMRTMAAYDRLACFGFFIEDSTVGTVRPGPGGRPLLRYDLTEHDTARLRRGMDILAQIYFQAGASQVSCGIAGHELLRTRDDQMRLRRARLSASDFELTAYHPLGSARMGADRRSSVVDAQLQAHDLPGLYIFDGSVLPTSPAVNPQLTIMAVVSRAARSLAARLS